jgi:hypothetical protein
MMAELTPKIKKELDRQKRRGKVSSAPVIKPRREKIEGMGARTCCE